MRVTVFDTTAAHRHCFDNRDEVQASDLCGCIYCLTTFTSAAVSEWCDEDATALCPNCHIDTVLGSKAGFPLSAEFLSAMKKRWFSLSDAV